MRSPQQEAALTGEKPAAKGTGQDGDISGLAWAWQGDFGLAAVPLREWLLVTHEIGGGESQGPEREGAEPQFSTPQCCDWR